MGGELYTSLAMGEVPDNDTDFEEGLLALGKGLEEAQWENKWLGFKKGPNIFGNRQSGDKKDMKRDEYTPAQSGPSGTNKGSKKKKPTKSSMKNSSDKPTVDQPKKRVHFANWEEAHEGIPKE